MTLEHLKDMIILVSAGISAVGIPALIGLIWKFHEAQVKALQIFTFKEVEQQISALENTYVRVNKRLREYVEELEKQRIEEPQKDIEGRIEMLKAAQKELSSMHFVLTHDLQKEYEPLYRAFGHSNQKAFQTVQNLLSTLIAYEETLKKKIDVEEARTALEKKE